ncbi:LysR family transcriptional regulator [Streptomyces radiopugnans]|uniref:LysR family transcriptional regulator n=1 Tax=Streptomyces radiopugnans TaxID=403935 RepID=UPI003F19DEB9
MIDLRLLQTLRVLAEYGTVHAAARALCLSPSAVSQQLRQLARETGAELLEREGRRVRLTPAAHVLLEHADALFEQWERARADLSPGAPPDLGTVRMCGFASSVGTLLAPAAVRLRRAHPRWEVRVAEVVTTAECYRLLLADRADIGVLTPLGDSPPLDDSRFDQRPLLDDPQDLVVPAGHPLAGRAEAELADAAREEWIAPHRDQHDLILALCAAAGFVPSVTHHADEWQGVLALIAHGMGVCLVPRLVPTGGHDGVARVPLRGSPAPYRRVLTCVRRGSHGRPPVAEALRTLEETRDQMRTPLARR